MFGEEREDKDEEVGVIYATRPDVLRLQNINNGNNGRQFNLILASGWEQCAQAFKRRLRFDEFD